MLETEKFDPEDPEQKEGVFRLRAVIGYGLLILLGLQLLTVLITIPLFAALGYTLQEMLASGNFIVFTTLIWHLLSLATLFLVIHRKTASVGAYLQLAAPGRRELLITAGAFLIASVLVEVATAWLDIPANSLMLKMIAGSNLALVAVTLTLVAPVFEEAFFRGFLFNELEKRYSGVAAVVVTTLLFAVIHLQYNPVELLFVVFIGGWLGYLRLRFRNLAIPIGVHLLNNALSLLFYLFVY